MPGGGARGGGGGLGESGGGQGKEAAETGAGGGRWCAGCVHVQVAPGVAAWLHAVLTEAELTRD